jgi:hypothetical protein
MRRGLLLAVALTFWTGPALARCDLEGKISLVCLSPDGRSCAFERRVSSNLGGILQIWTADLQGRNQRLLREVEAVDGARQDTRLLGWSADGSKMMMNDPLRAGLTSLPSDRLWEIPLAPGSQPYAWRRGRIPHCLLLAMSGNRVLAGRRAKNTGDLAKLNGYLQLAPPTLECLDLQGKTLVHLAAPETSSRPDRYANQPDHQLLSPDGRFAAFDWYDQTVVCDLTTRRSFRLQGGGDFRPGQVASSAQWTPSWGKVPSHIKLMRRVHGRDEVWDWDLTRGTRRRLYSHKDIVLAGRVFCLWNHNVLYRLDSQGKLSVPLYRAKSDTLRLWDCTGRRLLFSYPDVGSRPHHEALYAVQAGGHPVRISPSDARTRSIAEQKPPFVAGRLLAKCPPLPEQQLQTSLVQAFKTRYPDAGYYFHGGTIVRYQHGYLALGETSTGEGSSRIWAAFEWRGTRWACLGGVFEMGEEAPAPAGDDLKLLGLDRLPSRVLRQLIPEAHLMQLIPIDSQGNPLPDKR